MPGEGYLLLIKSDGLALASASGSPVRPLRVDFSNGSLARRARQAGIRNEALARAVGVGRGLRPRVIDATAGLGRDAFVLAALGCQVLMFERNRLLALLLADGLQRAHEHGDSWLTGTSARMQLVVADARGQLPSLLPLADRHSVICVDPMFSDGRGSAAAGREMHYLQALKTDVSDGGELLATALSSPCAFRVVVKRPVRAGPLGDHPPSHRIPGRSTRFDVYQRNSC